MKKSLLGLGMVLAISACSGTTATVDESQAPPATQAVAEETLTPDESPAATAVPENDKKTFKAGETITITSNDEDWATVVISQVKQVKGYGDYDRPQTKGNVFIQALVTYKALKDGVDYNPFDWQVFVNGEAVENYAVVLDGPKPTLSSGTLPKGRSAKGYVVYEVPAKGQVLMSYSGNSFLDEPPVFEVILRAK